MTNQWPGGPGVGHISADRLSHYLTAMSGDLDAAAALYVWNAQLAAAFFVDLGHLEVALRNALDARMTLRHDRLNRQDTWLDDPSGELGRDRTPGHRRRHKQPYADIDRARRRVSENGRPLDHGQIISETSFGLWHQLVSKRHATTLWPELADAFPHAPSRDRAHVADRVADLRDLRNRIGHHHRVWHLPCAARHAQLQELAGFMDPDLADWIEAGSTVRTVLAQRPAPSVSRGKVEP